MDPKRERERFEKAQRSTERPREAKRGPERYCKDQRGPEMPRETQMIQETRGAKQSPESPARPRDAQ